MKKVKAMAVLSFVVLCSTIKAQVEISGRADFVSSYVWRGQDCGLAAFQPGIAVSYAGFSLSAWGSTSLRGTHKEFDLLLGYEIGGFSIGITDYFFPVGDYFDYSTHQFEANLAYTISESLPLSIAWNTMFAGADKDGEDKQLFSSYFELNYSLSAGDIILNFVLGATPWKGMYSDGFALTNISITGNKVIAITDQFEIPVFTQIVLNSDLKDVHFVFGISF